MLITSNTFPFTDRVHIITILPTRLNPGDHEEPGLGNTTALAIHHNIEVKILEHHLEDVYRQVYMVYLMQKLQIRSTVISKKKYCLEKTC